MGVAVMGPQLEPMVNGRGCNRSVARAYDEWAWL